ncbi:MAG TPA: metalloregulator ArsR/SmtB family transcription factor [Gammaproteobacteria bacterium]|nr:metalloregulator ArsR/SmtB family transcription factor [Gammaproteobacteria bacterium]
MAGNAADAARLLKALSHEKRLLILCHLLDRELTVGEINARVSGSQSAISQHLAVLRRDGLVATRREAQTIFYSLRDTGATRIIEVLHDLFCARGQ